MSLSSTFIQKPVATSLLMVAIIIFGAIAYRTLGVSDLPNVDFPTLQVSASLPGANPDTMSTAVATPLERQFSTIAGLDSMSSTSSFGNTSITLQFNLNRDLDGAAGDVQAAITQAAGLLPPGMPSPPTFRKVNPADQPVMFLTMTSPTLPPWTLTEYADTIVAQRISTVPGVAQVALNGAQKYAVRVHLDPQKLAAKQVGINEIETALRNWNVNAPTGTLFGSDQTLVIRADGQLTSAADYRNLVVAQRGDSSVRLEDLGNVIDSTEDERMYRVFNTPEDVTRSISLAIQKQPGSNTVQVSDSVRALLPSIRESLPQSIDMKVSSDRSTTIRDSFEDVKFTMLLSLGLVVMVIFIFLRNLPATAIPSLALPFSIIGTFVVMALMNYTLDNLSLMALILSIGFVVDDAIVMLENIVRHIEMGEPPLQAALNGSREISFTIVSMTLSLAAVFIPVLFMSGIVGRLFREFAVTITAAILISGVVSLTLTPMLCSRFLKAHDPNRRHGLLFRATERIFDGILDLYDHSLQWVLRHRALTLTFSLMVLVATLFLFNRIPKGFIPDADNNQILIQVEGQQGVSSETLTRNVQALSEIGRKDPAVYGFSSGVNGGNSNTTQIFYNLKPRAERDSGGSIDVVMARLRQKFAQLPYVKVYLQNPPSIRIGGQITTAVYQYTLQGTNTEELYSASTTLLSQFEQVPGILDVSSDLQLQNPELRVTINRDKAAALRVNVQQIESALFSAYGPRWVSTIYAPTNQYKVMVDLLPEYQARPEAMSLLYLKSDEGRLIPLSTLAQVKPSAGPQSIRHIGQIPAVTLSFNLLPGVALGDAVSRIDELTKSLPATISGSFQGAAKEFQSSMQSLTLLLGIAIIVIYIVLGILYESYVHPLTILSGLPSAIFGALLTLSLFHLDLNIYGFVGLIMLIGIVKKNAIMQIDFALAAERNEDKAPLEAIYQGCLVRFRPIMMTSMAAMLGAIPIALGLGAGGDVRRPMGLAIVGGLLFSQLITLYLTPVIYTYMAAFSGGRASAKRTAQIPSVPAPAAR